MKKKDKKIYIIIINFKGWHDTVECIESILKNSYKNYQIVIVDNHSQDDSLDQFIAWSKRYKIPYVYYKKTESEDIKYIQRTEKKIRPTKKLQFPLIFIQSDKNEGFSAGNNIGIKYALLKNDADYCWILNNDTIIMKNALHEMVILAENHDDYGIIGSKLLFHHSPETIQTLGNDNVGWKGIGNGRYDGIKDSKDICEEIETRSVIGASLLIKNRVIDEIGLMDENYFMQHEESDWCTKAYFKGYKLMVNCRSVILHKEGASTKRKRIIKSFLGKKVSRTNIFDFLMWGYYSFRNEIYFVKKNFPKKFFLYTIFIIPKKLFIKSVSIFLFNDDYKLKRLYLISRAVLDGLMNKMGKTIDPVEWKKGLYEK